MDLASLKHNLVNSIKILGFPGSIVVKNLPANAGDARDSGLIPGLGKSPRGGNGNPLQYSSRDNPSRRTWWATIHGVAESDMIEQLSMHTYIHNSCTEHTGIYAQVSY